MWVVAFLRKLKKYSRLTDWVLEGGRGGFSQVQEKISKGFETGINIGLAIFKDSLGCHEEWNRLLKQEGEHAGQLRGNISDPTKGVNLG